jgi:hypothetical protein
MICEEKLVTKFNEIKQLLEEKTKQIPDVLVKGCFDEIEASKLYHQYCVLAWVLEDNSTRTGSLDEYMDLTIQA